MSGKRANQNEKAGIVGLIGGILMLIAGVTGAATWGNIGEQAVNITGIDALGQIFQVLVLIGSLGGFLVIMGSVFIGWNLGKIKTTTRVKSGKLMITIGAGFGMIGLLILLLITMLGEDPFLNFLGAIGIGFIGLIMSIYARQKSQ
ncbi:MAG: hypothetical protein Q7J68_05440 [Thermoplasmata archaeon]|nr:hypothetical protein [Thermoplasmata archaeon]